MAKHQKIYQKRGLVKKSHDIARWYNNVILRSDLAEYSEVKGCMVIKANGYALWEKAQSILDAWFKHDGVKNYYFPLLIPYGLLKKEKEHLQGFSPELAVVTHAGGEKLKEPYVIRPTSETIMYKTFAEWIHSYRDLPLKVNQWCNVVRWEKRTYPFLRTTEFLWQEGHTVHQTEKKAVEMALKALRWYQKFYEEYFAISPYIGVKSEQEKFAGAKTTYSVELVIPNGKALQGATSHNLSDNFSKVFDIVFTDSKGNKRHGLQTSWGLSTRAIGGLVLVHGDDAGLILPPKVAPLPVVIMVVADSESKAKKLQKYAENIADDLKNGGVAAMVDTNYKHSLGYRINEQEIKGVPLRLEIGEKEIKNKKITFARRDTFEKGYIRSAKAVSEVKKILDLIQKNLFARSRAIQKDLTREVSTYEQLKKAIQDKKHFIFAFWCEKKDCENKIKKETRLSTRVLELDEISKKNKGVCVYCGKDAGRRWLFAQSY